MLDNRGAADQLSIVLRALTVPQEPVSPLQANSLVSLFDHQSQSIQIERLDDIVVSTGFHRFDRVFDVPAAGN